MSYKNNLVLNNNKKAITFFTLSIIISPFLSQYTSYIPGVTLGDVVLGISSIIILLTEGVTFNIKKSGKLVLFLYFGLLTSLVSLLIQQVYSLDIITRYIRFSFYIFVVLIGINKFDLSYALKVYRLLCIAVSVYIILQTLFYTTTGIILPFKILGIPWASGKTFDILDVKAIADSYYYRPSGIFIEPGYAAQFLLPGLAISLYGWNGNKKINFRIMGLLMVALLLTTSSQAILISGIIIFIYVLSIIKDNRSFKKLFMNILIIVALFVLTIFFLNLSIVQRAISRVTGNIVGGSSVALRLYRGFAVFIQLPFLYKVIGVGHGNLGNFVISHGLITKYDPVVLSIASAEYANGISTVLVYYGVIGLVILSMIYFDFLRHTKREFRLITIIQIILSFVGGSIFGVSIVFYFSLIFASYDNNDNINKGGKLLSDD